MFSSTGLPSASQMETDSYYGQRGTARLIFSGGDGTSSVSRKEFVGGGRWTDQQENWQVDFPASGTLCMCCRQCVLFYHLKESNSEDETEF